MLSVEEINKQYGTEYKSEDETNLYNEELKRQQRLNKIKGCVACNTTTQIYYIRCDIINNLAKFIQPSIILSLGIGYKSLM